GIAGGTELLHEFRQQGRLAHVVRFLLAGFTAVELRRSTCSSTRSRQFGRPMMINRNPQSVLPTASRLPPFAPSILAARRIDAVSPAVIASGGLVPWWDRRRDLLRVAG